MDQYFQFDLSKVQLVAESYKTPKDTLIVFDRIINYSIYAYSQKLIIDPDNMIRQIIYHFHNGGLPEWIKEITGDIEEPDYKGGFIGAKGEKSTYEPEIDPEYFENIKQIVFKNRMYDEVENWYRMNQALTALGYKYMDDPIRSLIIPYTSKDPNSTCLDIPIMPKVTIHPRWYAMANNGELNVYDLTMIMAISSIIGRKKYGWASKLFISKRMTGANNNKDFEQLLKVNSINDFYNSIGRKRFDNSMKRLRRMKIIKGHYIHKRNTLYLSFELNDEELKTKVQTKKALLPIYNKSTSLIITKVHPQKVHPKRYIIKEVIKPY